jgi:hypothetical protein
MRRTSNIPRSFQHNRGPRRGITTVWVLLMVPVIGLLVIVITDVSNLWLARIELKNALDAAAASAVETWCEGDNSSANRAAARVDARDAFEANTILGVSLDFPDASFENNGGGNPGNASCTHNCPGGIVLLGSIRNTTGTMNDPPPFVFNANIPPDKIFLTVEVNSDQTFDDDDAYRVSLTGATDLRVDNVVIRIPATDPGTQGFFDTRAGEGFGPVQASGPAAVLTGTDPDGPAPGVGPPFGAVTFRTLTIDFTGSGGLGTTQTATFGLDSDAVGGAGGANDGGDFAGVPVTVTLSDGTVLSGPMTLVDSNTARFRRLLGQNECAAHVSACVDVSSICTEYLGMGFGPYRISGTATAWYRCMGPPTTEPELIRATVITCGP